MIPGISSKLLSSLKKLLDLDLSFNLLKAFPYSADQLPELQSLDIKGNPVKALPNFLASSSLQQLYFDWALIGFAEERAKSDIEGFSFKVEILQRSMFLIDTKKLVGTGNPR